MKEYLTHLKDINNSDPVTFNNYTKTNSIRAISKIWEFGNSTQHFTYKIILIHCFISLGVLN